MTTGEIFNGIYRARAVGALLTETRSGKEQVAVEFELLDEGFVGRRITWYGYFTEKTTERTLRTLRTCGWLGMDLTDLAGIESNEVSLVIENQEYEGRTIPRVQWVNAVGGMGTRPPMPADKQRALAQRMKAALVALDRASGTPRTTGEKRAPMRAVGTMDPRPEPPDIDDDMPF